MDKHSHAKLLILFTTIALGKCELSNQNFENTLVNSTQARHHQPASLNKHLSDIKNSESHPAKYSSDMEEFENVLFEYVDDVLNRKKIDIMPGVYVEKKDGNKTNENIGKRSFDENLISTVKEFVDSHALRIDLARATSGTGRLFFFKGKFESIYLKCRSFGLSSDQQA